MPQACVWSGVYKHCAQSSNNRSGTSLSCTRWKQPPAQGVALAAGTSEGPKNAPAELGKKSGSLEKTAGETSADNRCAIDLTGGKPWLTGEDVRLCRWRPVHAGQQIDRYN
eukprot:scaffold20998_cov118-Isochrysis_galbana.AAC.2